MASSLFKSTLFKTLDILPQKIGFYLYHQIQNMLFKNLDSKIRANEASYKKCQNILEKQGFSLEHKNVLEIGSGWMPMMPYFFKMWGDCSQIYSYDINEHYDTKYIDQLNKSFADRYDYHTEVSDGSKYRLPSFVKYYPKRDISEGELPKDVDLVFSRFVLEHVNPSAMVKMHENLRQLKEDTLILHLISPSDHRAYTDKSLSLYDFLKYSQKEWDQIQTKFDYHNRLRLPQYMTLFENTGFEILEIQYDVPEKNTEKYTAFKELQIHEDFKKYKEEELLAGSINVLLRKKRD